MRTYQRRRLRIVHVGAFGYRPAKHHIHQVCTKLSNGWIRNGHHVLDFGDREIAAGKAPFGVRHWGRRAVNRILLDYCRATRPDVLALGHADHIDDATIVEIRNAVPGVRILNWNIDWLLPPEHPMAQRAGADQAGANFDKVAARAAVSDFTFVSTAGRSLELLRQRCGHAAFMPNPADPSIEVGQNHRQAYLRHDLIVCAGARQTVRHHCGAITDVAEVTSAIRDGAEVSISHHGFDGAPPVWGCNYEDAISSAAMGLNLSRVNDVYLYSSDRLAQYAGNGLAVLIERASGYGELFGEDQMLFYSSPAELVDKVRRYARDPAARMDVARKGRERYFQLFDCSRVSEYLTASIFGEVEAGMYEWPVIGAYREDSLAAWREVRAVGA